MDLLQGLLGYRSVMDQPRTSGQEYGRGLLASLLQSGAGLADAAATAVPGRPIGAPSASDALARLLGPAEANPAAYQGGLLSGDVAQMFTPGGLLGAGSKARLGMPNQVGAIGPKRPTVRGAIRQDFPGIYDDPRDIARAASENVAPENPLMKQLFGVNRDELHAMSAGRQGNADPTVKFAANPKGSEAAEKVMTPANTQRLQDILGEASKYPNLTKGMDAWYTMDPAYQRLVQLVGPEEAKRKFTQLNTLSGMSSPSSDVLTEINRGTGANYLATQGRFDDFQRYGGMAESARGRNYPADMRDIKGHAYHSTAMAPAMRKFLDSGQVQMDSPKVPAYIQASGVPETGFQTRIPVGDAHWSRGVGLADTRTNQGYAASVSTPELQQLGPWWERDVAKSVGLESVPAQARLWGTLAKATGVDTPVGAPKLELLTQRIAELAKRKGISPEQARDLVLTGRDYAGIAGAGIATGLLSGGKGEPTY